MTGTADRTAPGTASTVTVTVEDLRCPCCAEAVLDAVRAVDGVRAARLDYPTSELRVALDPAAAGEEIVATNAVLLKRVEPSLTTSSPTT